MGAENDQMKAGIDRVVIDRTNEQTEKKSVDGASKLKLDGFAKRFAGTGYGVLINTRDRRVVAKVTSEMATEQISAAAKVVAQLDLDA